MSGKLNSVAEISSQYVDLSRWSFAIWWTLLLVLHLVTGGYNAAFALFYHELQHTYLYLCLDYSGIGMPAENHQVISLVNAVMAAIHSGCVLLMVGGSIWRRELAFSPWRKVKDHAYTIGKLDSTDKTAGLKTKDGGAQPKSRLARAYSKVLGRRGLIGVNGNSFHAILLAREFVETAIQTVQAYRMSWLLPRMLLNRFYLSLIVLNCWSSVLVYSVLFKRNEARKRFAYLVCDCTLNLVSSIGVPLVVVFTYVGEYDPELTGFALEKWYDDEWSARVLNEFQMILVVSWMDLASRTIFSIGVLATANNLKDLLRRSAGASSRRIGCDAEPATIASNNESPETTPTTSSGIVRAHQKNSGCRTRVGHSALHAVYGVFALWGFVVIGLHIQASVQPEQPQCALQVRPWAVSNPACYLAVLDCHRLAISGEKAEVEAKWSEFDRSTVVTLVIRHCPALEVPDLIADFHITTGIKVYNSTINAWGESAAITNSNHPELIWFYLVRVNVKDGVLPDGVLSADFPGNLYDLEFTYTNVRELPDDLDSKWLLGTTVYFEYSELTSVPASLIRLEPYSISLTGSPITELPPEIFEVADMYYMYMASISIQGLPRNVTNLSPQLAYVVLAGTNVSVLWPWIDTLVQSQLEWSSPLFMGGSPYCTDVENVISGEATTFSVPPSSEYSPTLMDPSKGNRDFLSRAVNCDEGYAGTVYPIDFEDSINALA
ncbi:Centrosomal protein of 41 kDa [Phytophthora pseudosyringae]|uniref:Centrosomal protein of 41 kDa n=1 Tax=Phytophthora pseudosyringae TaxID=221518 RepID=A0A8T1VQJ9_9STRA|nr:Centrosomal protein of 41 kDa [Phytophthora pseudosyringae]